MIEPGKPEIQVQSDKEAAGEVTAATRSFCPLPFDRLLFLVNKRIAFDVFLKAEKPGPDDGSEFFLFLARGELLEAYRLQKIKKRGTQVVYYHHRDRRQVDDFLKQSFLKSPREARLENPALPARLPWQDWQVTKIPSIWEPEDNFLQIKLNHLLPEWEVPFDVYVKISIPGETNSRYVLCCPKGEGLRIEVMRQFEQKGIIWAYVPSDQQNEVIRYFFHNLSNTIEDEESTIKDTVEIAYELTILWVRQFFQDETLRFGKGISMGLDMVQYLFHCLEKDPHHLGWLVAIVRHDGKLYSHCVNCCLLGLAFTRYLNWPEKKILEFALGALLHDIGMTRIPQETLRKARSLSKPEMDLIKQHPEIGFQLLSVANLPRDSLLPAIQHHEDCTGTGYPYGLVTPMIDPAGRIIRILDSFDALTSPRPWRTAYPPLEALKIMSQDWQQRGIFDLDYLEAFIKFLARP